jgi:hypothetical protein
MQASPCSIATSQPFGAALSVFNDASSALLLSPPRTEFDNPQLHTAIETAFMRSQDALKAVIDVECARTLAQALATTPKSTVCLDCSEPLLPSDKGETCLECSDWQTVQDAIAAVKKITANKRAKKHVATPDAVLRELLDAVREALKG